MLWRRFRSLVPHSIKRVARKFVWMRLNPSWTLPSGILVRVLSYSDWLIYNDIFVDGEYDRPIHELLKPVVDSARTVQVVDLGANVGFFTLRLADAFLRKGGNNFNIVAVEGSPLNFAELQERLGANANLLRDRVRTINGLIGHRGGVGEISEGESCGENAIFGEAGSRATVPFVDLDALLQPLDAVDLLKCDIEGAEELFVHNYPGLLAKTERAVFEFHHDKCDVARCRQALAKAGLKQTLTLRKFGHCSVEFFHRNLERAQ